MWIHQEFTQRAKQFIGLLATSGNSGNLPDFLFVEAIYLTFAMLGHVHLKFT